MDRQWSEDTFADFQPPQPEFYLQATSPIISQVPALTCSDTAHPSPSAFLSKQYDFRISPIINHWKYEYNFYFAGSFPNPPQHHQTDPNTTSSWSLYSTSECPPRLTHPETHQYLSPHSPGGLCLDTLSTNPTHPSKSISNANSPWNHSGQSRLTLSSLPLNPQRGSKSHRGETLHHSRTYSHNSNWDQALHRVNPSWVRQGTDCRAGSNQYKHWLHDYYSLTQSKLTWQQAKGYTCMLYILSRQKFQL